MKQLNINFIYKLFNFILGIIITTLFSYFWIRRFYRLAFREIFSAPYYEQGLIFSFILLINVIILYQLIKCYFNIYKINNLTLISEDLFNWCKTSLKELTILLTNIKFIDYPISYMTHYYLKIPIKLHYYLTYCNQILLMFAVLIDVFYLECFFLTYKMIYLFLLELVLSIIHYISETFNNEVLNEVTHSINVINIEKALHCKELFTVEDYALSKYNTQFTSIQHALDIREFVINENLKLYEIEHLLKKPLLFHIIKRIYYTILWIYILYFYQYPIFYKSLIILYQFMFNIPFIIILGIIPLMHYLWK